VIIGSTAHDNQASGLVIKSEKTMELRVPTKEIALGRGYISGRYGPPVPLENSRPPKTSAKGILQNSVRFPLEGENVAVDLVLQDLGGGSLTELPDRPVAYVGDTVIPGPYSINPTPCEAINRSTGTTSRTSCVLLHFTAPGTIMRKDTLVTVRIPFQKEEWSTTLQIYPPTSVTGVSVLGGSPDVSVAITGKGFDTKWSVLLDKTYDSSSKTLEVTPNQLRFKVNEAVLAKYKQVVVQPPSGNPGVILALPASTPPKPKPTVSAGQSFTVAKDSAPRIEIAGENLTNVKAVKFGEAVLPSQADDGGKKLIVLLTRETTKAAGPVAIRLEREDGSFIPVVITVQ
jgi:hypothetical protein